jgi:catechol 2,3-dioxygenase-like lactoylglutathione lyase family enzyme
MNHQGLDHLAIAVPDTEAALKLWRDTFGFKVLYTEDVNGGTVRLTHLDLGNTQLQLESRGCGRGAEKLPRSHRAQLTSRHSGQARAVPGQERHAGRAGGTHGPLK